MRTLLPYITLLLIISACRTKEDKNMSIDKAATPELSPLQRGEVQILTKSMEFFSADTLYSGWNTLHYENQSQEVHFVLMDLYPEGKTIANTKAELLPPFDEGMRLIMENKMDSAMAAFGEIPEWYFEVKFMGGTGLTSPKRTTKSTVYLEPGLYTMECYVKMFNGEWHTSHGMLKQIIVKEESTTLEPPAPTVTVDVSSTNGIVLHDSISSGKQIIRTNFLDQKTWEHFVGHDVNLVKYENDADLNSLIQWMNWMDPKGLTTPAPEGFTFLGGMNNLPSGEHGYFEADLTPGNYILISEVPDADKKKLMRKFTIK